MATVTTLAGGTIPGVNGADDWGVGTILLSTPSVFSWTSTDGHKVTLVGSFVYGGGPGTIPTSGTVNTATFDGDDNGTNDMTVDYGAGGTPFVTDMTSNSSFGFSNGYFGQADTMTLASTVITGDSFTADGGGGSGSPAAQSDNLTITGSGHFTGDYAGIGAVVTVNATASDTFTVNSSGGAVAIGDVNALSSVIVAVTFAGDTMTDTSSLGGTTNTLVGDVFQAGFPGITLAGSATFGNDIISSTTKGAILIGDVVELNANDFTAIGGVDTFNGGTGNDTIIGDVDEITSFSTNSQVTGGNDNISGGGGNDTLIGDVRNLNGTSSLVGGNDTIDGQSGDDTIFGDYQTINGTSVVAVGGNDILIGGTGNDTLFGQEGDDNLFGGADDDTIDGGTGSDTASYLGSTSAVNVSLEIQGAAQDTGGDGIDTLISIENLQGSAHDDILAGNSGDNVLTGSAGNDTVTYAAASSAVTVDLTLLIAQNTLGAGMDTLLGIENLVGTTFNDTLSGDTLDNILEGGVGNDVLDGDGGTDTASYASAASAVTVSLAQQGAAQNTFGAGNDTLSNFENLTGSDFADTLTGDGNANTIEGGDGNDTINAGAGQDVVFGGEGRDFFIDTENGASGNNDVYDGGQGVDTLISTAFAWSNITEFNLTTGFQTVSGGLQRDQLIDIENLTISGNATLTGDAEDNVLTAVDSQGIGTNTINGMDGNDTIIGGQGDDILNGGDGDDTIFGGTGLVDNVNSGNDTINGGAGNDTIIYSRTSTGTLDVDIMDGGDDIDTFVLQNIIGTRIVDLAAGQWGTGSIDTNVLAVRGTLTNFENVTVSSNVHVRGDSGNNVIRATDANGENIFEGGLGDDTLDGGGGDNDVAIYSGNFEEYTFLPFLVPGSFQVIGPDGTDAVQNIEFFQFDDITVDASILAATQIRGTSDPDTLGGTAADDVILGLDGNDDISSLGGADLIFGGDGNDTINASNGDDTLLGGAGDDDLVGGAGADVLNGGANDAGGDTATYSNSDAAVQVNLNTGVATGGHAEGDTFGDIENLFGSVFGDTLTGDGGSNTINGFNGNDVLDGGLGDDTLQGGNGDDTFISSTGADVFSGGTGNDTADYSGSNAGVTAQINNGGTVNGGHATGDTLIVENIIGSAFADDIIGNTLANELTGNDGDDTFNASSGNDTILGGGGDDFILGSRGGDIINGGTNTAVGDTASYSNSDARVVVDLIAGTATGSGHGSGDTLIDIENIFGSLFNDDIFGDNNANVLEGFNGVDELFGRGGNDTLIGGGGFDFLNGGEGNDTLTGSGGTDQFQFDTANFGQDTITDFTNNLERMDFRGSGLQFADLTITTNATNTVITVTAAPVNSITLTGVTSLINEADFIFDPVGSLEVPGNSESAIETLELADQGGYAATDDLIDMMELTDAGGFIAGEDEIQTLDLIDNGGYQTNPEDDFGLG